MRQADAEALERHEQVKELSRAIYLALVADPKGSNGQDHIIAKNALAAAAAYVQVLAEYERANGLR